MAPAYAIPRLLARNGLTYDDIALWELHEAFTAQVASHIKAIESGPPETASTIAGAAFHSANRPFAAWAEMAE